MTPAIVLRATNSVGVSLLLWSLGAIFGLCGLLVWLELGLSIPKFQNPDETTDPLLDGEGAFENVPRSGGEKNYVCHPHPVQLIGKYAEVPQLEYIYKDPRFQTTCMYGVIFVILGNLTGNAIAFGQYVMQAAGNPNQPEAVRGVAVAVLTAACLIHGLWRNGGIVLNNVLAGLKVATLLGVIIIGFATAGGASFGNGSLGRTASKANFDTRMSFASPNSDAANYARSIVYIVYSYSGFKQPFYVSNDCIAT